MKVQNIKTLHELYLNYEDVPKKSHIASIQDVAKNDFNLNLPLYIQKYDLGEVVSSVENCISEWKNSSKEVQLSTKDVLGLVKEEII